MNPRLVLVGVFVHLGASLAWGAPPANDDFTNRIALVFTGSSMTVTGSNLGATREPEEPSIYHGLGRTVWYSWQATRTGPVVLDVFSPTDSEYFGVYVFTGETLDALSWATSFSLWDGSRRKSLFDAEVGTNYSLMVESVEMPFSGPGDFVLQMELPTAPSNDGFAGRLPLAGRAAVGRGSTVGATRELDDPIPSNPEGVHSVWWTWTAPTSGTATVAGLDPAGLPREPGSYPTLGIYTGSELASLVQVTNNWTSSGPPSQLDFSVSAGRTYQIMVAAKSSERSAVAFTVTVDGAALLADPKLAQEGDLLFQLIGAPWRSYRIESSTQLGAWEPVSNVICIFAPVPVSFPQEPSAPTRFFRAVLQPQ